MWRTKHKVEGRERDIVIEDNTGENEGKEAVLRIRIR
jgi:hypothetical protein